jgi:hypothetical protein
MKEFVCSDKRSFRRFVCTLLCWLLGGTDKFDLVFHIRTVGRSENLGGPSSNVLGIIYSPHIEMGQGGLEDAAKDDFADPR